MGYFCWKCKTKDHWANELCPKEKRNVPTGDTGLDLEQGEKGDEIRKREGNLPGGETVLSGSSAQKDGESGNSLDARQAELRGTAVHQKVQKGGRAVSGKKNPVEIAQDFIKRLPGRPKTYPDPKARRRDYMRAYRARKGST